MGDFCDKCKIGYYGRPEFGDDQVPCRECKCPGWNHRGVYVLAREKELKGKIKRKLSDKAHRRMRMVYDRKVNTTSCEPDDYLRLARTRWHPHKKINKALITAPIVPYISRKYRRNLGVLD